MPPAGTGAAPVNIYRSVGFLAILFTLVVLLVAKVEPEAAGKLIGATVKVCTFS
jgi:hypothetical protein